MTIKDCLKKYSELEIELLLARVLKKPKEFLYINPEHKLTPVQAGRLARMVRRRMSGEPMAYILGYKDFYGLRFLVNKQVLIPRPETEAVIDLVVANVARQFKRSPCPFGSYDSKLKILDLGTGSGCIIISLAKRLPVAACRLYASDISQTALAVAKQNARLHHAKIKFIRSDLLKNIHEDFDILIANLPYGWTAWKNNTSVATAGLKFEPQNALFTEEQGLYLYRLLLEQVAKEPRLPRLLYLEFDPRQKTALQRLVKKKLPVSRLKFYRDFRRLWRYAEIQTGQI